MKNQKTVAVRIPDELLEKLCFDAKREPSTISSFFSRATASLTSSARKDALPRRRWSLCAMSTSPT